MTKKKESRNRGMDHVVIVAEGDTETLFYKKVAEIYKKIECKITYIVVGGSGNFKSAPSKVRRDCCSKPKNMHDNFYIFLCYDSDVYEYSGNKYLDWNQIVSSFEKIDHVVSVSQIVAHRCIEDWFLLDETGIRKFLKMSSNEKFPTHGTGVDKIKKLFKDKGKFYTKGRDAKGFVDHLNIEMVVKKIEKDIKPLIDILNGNSAA